MVELFGIAPQVLFGQLLLELVNGGYPPALLIAPLIVGAIGVVIETTMLARLYKLDHPYGRS